jgi:uncharacterized protein YecA (UPF0149 family)
MDVNTGRVIDFAMLAASANNSRYKSRHQQMRPMEVQPTQKQIARKRIGRNDTCPCGSGRKFKNCCLGSHNK